MAEDLQKEDIKVTKVLMQGEGLVTVTVQGLQGEMTIKICITIHTHMHANIM